MKDKRTKDEVLSKDGTLLDDGYLHTKEVPNEIMQARFIEHHAREMRWELGRSPRNMIIVDMLYGAAKTIRTLHDKVPVVH